jgi:dTDP-4-dehydrorhamnose reductase
MPEKTIVFGKGFLGTKIAKHLDFDLTSLDPLDEKVLGGFLDKNKPEVVINAIGKTGRPNIDWCEENKEETMRSNVVAAVNLGLACFKREIYFVHLGSGCIYNGDNQGKGFTEEDPPNFYGPQFYAKTKILAEMVLKEFPCLILRPRMPLDDSPHERNLIDKLTQYPKVIDIQNSITTVPHMIDAMGSLISKKATGIYNFVNPGTISAFEIMTLYREIVDPNHNFELMSKEELDRVTKGVRSNCYLNTDKLKRAGVSLPDIHSAVEDCLIRYKETK